MRRFDVNDNVRRMYEWLKSAPPDPTWPNGEFELMFLGNNLIGKLDQTIAEAGLMNGDLATIQALDLARVDIDAHHMITRIGETSPSDQAHVSGAENRDAHISF